MHPRFAPHAFPELRAGREPYRPSGPYIPALLNHAALRATTPRAGLELPVQPALEVAEQFLPLPGGRAGEFPTSIRGACASSPSGPSRFAVRRRTALSAAAREPEILQPYTWLVRDYL